METTDTKKGNLEIYSNFPHRLYQLLEDLTKCGEVKPPIHWNADGLSFTIRDKAELRNLIQKYFNRKFPHFDFWD